MKNCYKKITLSASPCDKKVSLSRRRLNRRSRRERAARATGDTLHTFFSNHFSKKKLSCGKKSRNNVNWTLINLSGCVFDTPQMSRECILTNPFSPSLLSPDDNIRICSWEYFTQQLCTHASSFRDQSSI